jgi:hypothetical protein
VEIKCMAKKRIIRHPTGRFAKPAVRVLSDKDLKKRLDLAKALGRYDKKRKHNGVPREGRNEIFTGYGPRSIEEQTIRVIAEHALGRRSKFLSGHTIPQFVNRFT